MRGATCVNIDADGGVTRHNQARGAGVIQVNVSKHKVADVGEGEAAGGEAGLDGGQGAGGAGVHEGRLIAEQGVRRHHEGAPKVVRVDDGDAVGGGWRSAHGFILPHTGR